jgi:hypothetical protein
VSTTVYNPNSILTLLAIKQKGLHRMENQDSPEIIAQRWDRHVRDAITRNAVDGWTAMVTLRADLDSRGTRRPAQDEHLSRMEREKKITRNGDLDFERVRWNS